MSQVLVPKFVQLLGVLHIGLNYAPNGLQYEGHPVPSCAHPDAINLNVSYQPSVLVATS
jgi:hypothetical protein